MIFSRFETRKKGEFPSYGKGPSIYRAFFTSNTWGFFNETLLQMMPRNPVQRWLRIWLCAATQEATIWVSVDQYLS